MARKKANFTMNPTNTDSTNPSDDISSADLAAEKMNDFDPAVQSETMEDQEQTMGAPAADFAPVGASSVGADMPDMADMTDMPSGSGDSTPPAKLPTASEVKAKAADAANQAKEAAGQATETVKAQASEVLSQTKQTATEAFGKAKESVVSQLDGQIDRATDSLGGLTEALRQTGQQFKDQSIPFVPDYAEQFAGQLDKVSEYLKQNDVNRLAADAEEFARKNPALFIGGAFLLGIGIARFIKASGTNTELFTANSGSGSMGSLSSMDSANTDNLPAVASDVAPMGGSMTIPTERQDINSDDALPTGKVLSAHGYVPGGVAGGGSN